MTHSDTIRTLYDAFGKGDVATILAQCTEDIDWDNSRVASSACPWNGNFSGKPNVPGFFQAVGSELKFREFTPHTFIEQGNSVAVVLTLKSDLAKNGRPLENESVHLWGFAADGRVNLYRHFNDTAQEMLAWNA